MSSIIAERLDRLTQEIAELKRLLTEREDKIVDIDGAAAILGRTRNAMYQLTSTRKDRAPEIPHYKKVGKLYFKVSDLRAWMTTDRIRSKAEIEQEAREFADKRGIV